MGPDHAARLLHEVLDRARQTGLGGITRHVEHIDCAVVEAADPEEAAVVGEATVVRLVAAAYGDARNHAAVVRSLRVGPDRDQLVGSVPEALDPERPDVDEILVPRHLRQIGRLAGLVRPHTGNAKHETHPNGPEKASAALFHLRLPSR